MHDSEDRRWSARPKRTPCVGWITLISLVSILGLAPVVEAGRGGGRRNDRTPPSTPVVIDEGAYTSSTTTLRASWTSTDPESGIAQYQYLIRQDSPSGTLIVNWTSTGTTPSVTRTGLRLQHGKTYFFGVKAKNGAGRWSAIGWSDGIKVDTTPPLAVTVNDEGVTTSSPTLSATWTTSSDPESGVVDYQYLIRRDSPTGPLLVDWRSVGLVTGISHTTRLLQNGTTYYVGVRAQNGAGLWSAAAYSDGITVRIDTTPPTGAVSINNGAAYTASPAVTLTLSATDDSGAVTQMRFSHDGVTYTAPEPYATTKPWTLLSGDGTKTVSAQFADRAGNWSAAVSDTITLDTHPPVLEVLTPTPSATVTGASG